MKEPVAVGLSSQGLSARRELQADADPLYWETGLGRHNLPG